MRYKAGGGNGNDVADMGGDACLCCAGVLRWGWGELQRRARARPGSAWFESGMHVLLPGGLLRGSPSHHLQCGSPRDDTAW